LADIKLPGMLHAQVLRPEYAHAKILGRHTAEALASPGVATVVTGENCHIRYASCGFYDLNPLAVDKVRHKGEPVAVVVADSVAQARTALKKIRVDYEPLPVLIDPIEAFHNRDVIIHEKLAEYPHFASYYPIPGSNVFHHYQLRKGDIAKGWQASEVSVEGDFEMPLSAHSAMEPHGCIVRWNSPHDVEIWATSQAPFVLQEVVAEMFHLPQASVRVHVFYLGGAFGSKSDVTIEPMIVYAARQVPGRPVRFICSRKEVMTSTVLGRGAKMKLKLGATKTGQFTAFEGSLYFSDGASGDTATNVVTVAGHNAVGPYAIEHAHVDAYGVYTNTPPVGAYRGYGHPEGCFGMERLIDQLARKLAIPAEELRRKNFLREGRQNSLGETIRDYNGNLFKCLENIEKTIYNQPKPAEDATYAYGRGLAAMMKSPKGSPNASSCCQMKFCGDGSVLVNLGGIDMGQGAQTALTQIAAEALQLPPERITMYREIDTQHTPWEWQTVASMFTYRGGNAIVKTAAKLIEILKQTASRPLRCEAAALEYNGDYVYRKNDPDDKIAVKDLVRGFMYSDGVTVGEVAEATAGDRLPRYMIPDARTGMGTAGGTWTFGCQGCELKINKKTGEITIEHFASSFDVGQVISPTLIRGQIVGGVLMGIGQTLKEKIEFDPEGTLVNANWNKYKLPTIYDMPKQQTVICEETPEVRGPFGARCIAEHPMVAVAPTILNAIYDAIGIDFYKTPVTAQDIVTALQAKAEHSGK
jgi:carbon-monoxide dehydrogenase large subunit